MSLLDWPVLRVTVVSLSVRIDARPEARNLHAGRCGSVMRDELDKAKSEVQRLQKAWTRMHREPQTREQLLREAAESVVEFQEKLTVACETLRIDHFWFVFAPQRRYLVPDKPADRGLQSRVET